MGELGDAFVEYISAFAGFGLLALLVFHPKVAPSIIGGIQGIFTRVTDLGSTPASSSPPASVTGQINA